MSRHVEPHRWADAFAGKLGDRDVATMELHADDCKTCGRARERVQRASSSFRAIREQRAPELLWDGVRARVHWSFASEKRNASRRKRARMLVPSLGVGAVAACALTFLAVTGSSVPPTTFAQSSIVAAAATAPEVPTELSAILVRELGEPAMINGVVYTRRFDDVLGKGAVLATSRGTVDLQFGEQSGIAVAENSTLTFERFDSEQISLVLRHGSVDVTVAKRAANQRFTIRAGDRIVEVRGTQFRVSHDAANTTRVACVHGNVTVRDTVGEVEVTAFRKLEIAPTATLVRAAATELSVNEREQLAHAAPMTLPVWTSVSQLVQTTATLEVATSGRRDVRVDGVEVGQGPVRLRVMPGRHTVEAADAAGRFRRSGWVDVSAGNPARLDVQAEITNPSSGTSARRKQLHAGIDRARLATCTRALAKAGVTDAYVRIEIAVEGSGAVGFLNVIDTDLPSTTSTCVRDVLADVRFKSGPAATFREKLAL